jgi:ABC-type Zn uptake system ZnuABC Zn-binding protein ZnuA
LDLKPGRFLFRLSIGLAMLASACGGGATPAAPSTKLRVVTTVSPITNIIYNIGGSRIELTGIIPEGTDSHTFEPAPSSAQLFAIADVVFVNGLHLEEPTRKLAAANLKPGAEIVSLGEQALTPDQYLYDFSFPKSAGNPNPHLWMNPMNALRYAEIARDTLVRRDAANADFYNKNFDAFKLRLTALDEAIKTATGTIPEANRKLLTYHDSFAYFAPRYGLTVIGAIQPADFAEPSARDVADLITQIRALGLPAIFGSEVFPSPILAQIAKEAGAKYEASLRDDDLPGRPGEANHSYLGLMAEDVRTITTDLGGTAAALDNFDTANVPGLDGTVDQQQ